MPRWILTILLLQLGFGIPSAIGEAVFDVAKYGAVGDGVTSDTAAIQKTIDACAAGGGGTVNLGPGNYLIGTIQLKDNVILHLDDQAVLLGSTAPADYRNLDPFIDGLGNELGYALLVAVKAKNVGLEGSGIIDGRGTALALAEKKYTIRPFLVRWVQCTNVTVSDVHLTNPGAWTLNFFQCENANVSNVMIRSRGLANNDGIDLDSCQGANVKGCDIDSSDDAVCLKATSAQACQDITISDCKLRSDCNAVKLGTESFGDFQNINVSRCQIRETALAGLAFYSVDGSHLHDVTATDITMDHVNAAVFIRLGARLKTFRPGEEKKPVGELGGITIKNLRARRIPFMGILISGVPDHPVKGITFENVDIAVTGGGKAADAQVQLAENEATYPEIGMFGVVMPAYGIYARHVNGISFKNVQTSVGLDDGRPAVDFVDVQGAVPGDFGKATGP